MDSPSTGSEHLDAASSPVTRSSSPLSTSTVLITTTNPTLAVSTPTASQSEDSLMIRRRPIPKKGHTKSRRGCDNCKRRKVKCQETHPACANCSRLGLNCVYSGLPRSQGVFQAVPPPSVALSAAPIILQMEDLRFFHHFVFNAYPPLPMLGDAIWKDISALAYSVSPGILFSQGRITTNNISSMTSWFTPFWGWRRLISTCTSVTASHRPSPTVSRPSSPSTKRSPNLVNPSTMETRGSPPLWL